MISFMIFMVWLVWQVLVPVLQADISHVHEPYHFSEYEASSLGESAMFLNMYDNE